MNFEIEREDLLKLRETNVDTYRFIMSLSSAETDYCKTLDMDKLKSECEKGYFNIDDLFGPQAIKDAWFNLSTPVTGTWHELEPNDYKDVKPLPPIERLTKAITDKVHGEVVSSSFAVGGKAQANFETKEEVFKPEVKKKYWYINSDSLEITGTSESTYNLALKEGEFGLWSVDDNYYWFRIEGERKEDVYEHIYNHSKDNR